MSYLVPDAHDYSVVSLADASELNWAITQDGKIRRVDEPQKFAIRIVRHFARMSRVARSRSSRARRPFLLTLYSAWDVGAARFGGFRCGRTRSYDTSV